MTDLDIIELFFARDEKAIELTDKKYGKLCYRIAYNVLGDGEDSRECVNDTYVGLWNAIPPARPSNFSAFLCKIARNISLKRLEMSTRKKRAGGVLIPLEELSETLPDRDIADGVSDECIGEAISEFLRNEKEAVRNVFVRRYYFFDPISDIAKRYCFTESKVKNMLYHTRIKLKDHLKRKGIEI